MIPRLLLISLLFVSVASAQVTLHPGDNVAKIVSSKPPGTTFIFAPGMYRLSESIVPKDNDKFIGEASCAPPASGCPAIISGGIAIGSLATPEGGNYAVAKQMQHNGRGNPRDCDTGWEGCMYPEDLFFDGVPYKHLDSPSMPSIGPGEWWFDYANHVIYFHDDPSGHSVETSVLLTAFEGNANNITIQYLTVEEFADMYPFAGVGIGHGRNSLNQGANWTIENSEVKLNHGFGVRANYRAQILNNYIHDNGEVGIGGGIGTPAVPSLESMDSGILIQGNTIDHNDYAHFNPGFGAGGFKVGATSGIVIRGNTFRHNEGSAIHFDVDSGNELVDGNLITDNTDGDALGQEIGNGVSTFRNNIVLRNGGQVNNRGWSYQIGVRASTGVNVYCNVMEVPASQGGVGAWVVGAAKRGYSQYPGQRYWATTGNSVHHNTIIFDDGARGEAGFLQNDPENQPDFFANNAPPDYNSYHLSTGLPDPFVYDNNNSRSNKHKSLGAQQSSHAEVHSTADKNNKSGFPEVSITSPSDQSSVSSPVTISANASDNSGIRKVEFYVDWKLETTLTSSPYDFNWSDGTPGSHIVAAMAYSNAGIRACYAVTLNEQ
jgi:hypothetical protein